MSSKSDRLSKINVAKGNEMTDAQRRVAAKEFAEEWKGRGYEKGETETDLHSNTVSCIESVA